jgi:hypothetical protein
LTIHQTLHRFKTGQHMPACELALTFQSIKKVLKSRLSELKN